MGLPYTKRSPSYERREAYMSVMTMPCAGIHRSYNLCCTGAEFPGVVYSCGMSARKIFSEASVAE
jgi:hypothetical protein